MIICLISYLKAPCNLPEDRAKVFLAVEFTALGHLLGYSIIPAAVEAECVQLADGYLDTLRSVINKRFFEHLTASLPYTLGYANLKMSDTVWPERFTLQSLHSVLKYFYL